MADEEDLADQLLRLARDDLASAKALDGAEEVSGASSRFHAQQAVEKSLKAVLATREVDFPFLHNITLLMQLCGGSCPRTEPSQVKSDGATVLTHSAWFQAFTWVKSPNDPGAEGSVAQLVE
jgi:HEPN domain-containing protein